MRDREALQRERGADAAGADREILRRRGGQGKAAPTHTRNTTPSGQGTASDVGRSGHGRGRQWESCVERAAA